LVLGGGRRLAGFNAISTGANTDEFDLAKVKATDPQIENNGFFTLGPSSPLGTDTPFCEDFNQAIICSSPNPSNDNACHRNPAGIPGDPSAVPGNSTTSTVCMAKARRSPRRAFRFFGAPHRVCPTKADEADSRRASHITDDSRVNRRESRYFRQSVASRPLWMSAKMVVVRAPADSAYACRHNGISENHMKARSGSAFWIRLANVAARASHSLAVTSMDGRCPRTETGGIE
jgi:hypothetical protein